MSSRPNTPYQPRLCSDGVSKANMQRQALTLVLSVLLYATDTWTLRSADVRTLKAFHQKCPTQLLGIRWYDRVRHDEVLLQRTGVTSLPDLLSRRRISVFGHVARVDDTTANMALQLHVNVALSRPPDRTWRRPPANGRLEQLGVWCNFNIP